MEKTINFAARSVITDVLEIYKNRNITITITPSNAAKKLLLLHNEWLKLKKNRYRQIAAQKQRSRKFSEKFNKLFDILLKDVLLELMTKKLRSLLLLKNKESHSYAQLHNNVKMQVNIKCFIFTVI